MTQTPLLDVRHLRTEFDSRTGRHAAVRDVSFAVGRGRMLGLVGESGSGKSVTGFSIMGLVDAPGQVTGGQVIFDGRDIAHLSEREARKLRGNRIAMIFQDPMMTLNPVLRIDTQMIEALQAHAPISRRTARARASAALTAMGIADAEDRLKAYPHQLSGGMRQRVAIAIALLHRPDLIVADEPTTALDVTIQAQILSEVQRLVAEHGTALIWISHDLSVIAGLVDEIAVMYAGRIVEQGSVDDIVQTPVHPYTRGLIASLPANNEPGKPLQQIQGMAPSLGNIPDGCAFAPRCARATAQCATQPEPHQVTLDRVAIDRVAPDRVASDQIPLDRVAPDRVASDQIPLDRVALDRVALDRVAPDRITSSPIAVSALDHAAPIHWASCFQPFKPQQEGAL